jgi:NTP pyrophosphatase (non-canonical NTP hydrolase)
MDITAYQKQAFETSIYPQKNTIVGLMYTVLGLASEGGEIAGKLKKIIRDKDSIVSAEDKKEMSKELGDVAWYLCGVATELGLDMSDILQQNIAKLADRKARGVLSGNGDNR